MGYSYKTEPMRHQREALNYRKAWLADEFFWRMDMGTGKSKVAIDNCGALYERGKLRGLLVVAPNTVVRNWTGIEIEKHLPDRLPRQVLRWEAKSNRRAQYRKDWTSLLEQADFRKSEEPRIAVLVMNMEGLSTVEGVRDAQAFLLAHPSLFVIDESVYFKNYKAKRTKAVLKLGKLAPYRRIMSGLPVVKNPLDLFYQCEFLRHGILGDTSYYSFRSRYAITVPVHGAPNGVVDIVGWRGLEELRQILASFSYSVKKADCLDLPPKVYTKREVTLTPEQRRIYGALADDFEAEIASGVCTATNALTRILRLQQVLSGVLVTDDGVSAEVPTNRLATLLEVLEETQEKAIIWAPLRRDVTAIVAALRKAYGARSTVELHGDVKPEQRAENIKAFQERDTVRFIVGTPQTGGVGVTLTAATVVVYYANTWDLGIRAQSEDRAHRIGQTHAVTYVDLVATDTIDETILGSLREKRSLADALSGGSLKGHKWE